MESILETLACRASEYRAKHLESTIRFYLANEGVNPNDIDVVKAWLGGLSHRERANLGCALEEMRKFVDKSMEDQIRRAAEMKKKNDKWITKHVFKDLDRGDITIRQHSETKLVSIKDNETDEVLHIAKHRITDIASVLLDIESHGESCPPADVSLCQDDITDIGIWGAGRRSVIVLGQSGCYIRVERKHIKKFVSALSRIANDPAAVDGMTALKHIMDGGGAYRNDGNLLWHEAPIRFRSAERGPEFYQECILPGGQWVGHGFTAPMIAATDWVLVP